MLNKYLLCLYHQYCMSKGNICVYDDLSKLSYEFTEWISKNRLLAHEYLDYLKYLEVVPNDNIIEIGKGRYDSISNQEMEIVSPFANSLGFENSEFLIIGTIPIIEKQKEIFVANTDILLTHNPYFLESIFNWSKIHNSKKYDISVGMYGSIYDKDYEEKIKILKILANQMSDDYRFDYDTDKDKYFCSLNSDRKTKKLILKK